MKNKFLKGMTLVASLAFLASCGGNTDDKKDPVTPVESGVIKEATTIQFWSIIGTNSRPTFESFVESFKKVEPNVTVELNYISGSYTDLKDAVVKGFTSNNYPDLVQCYADHVAEYINYGKSVNLEDYMYNGEYGWSTADQEDIIQDYLQEGQAYLIDGTYSLPFCKSTEQMFYNADKLIGLNLSKYDKTINSGNPLTAAYLNTLTWDELFDKLCPAFAAYDADPANADNKLIETDTSKNAYSAYFAYDSDDNLFITLAQQYGYGYTSVDKSTGKASIDFNNEGMKSIVKKFHDAAEKGYIISKGSAGGNYTNTYFTNEGTLFSVGSTGGVKYQFDSANPMEVGVGRIPQADSNKAYTINQGPSLTVLDHNDENRKLASWLFYKHVMNAENSLEWSLNTGYSVVRKSGLESEEYKEASDYESKDEKTLDRLMAKSLANINNVGTLYASPAFKGSSTARTQAGNLMTKALTKGNNIADIDAWFAEAESTAKLAL